MRCILQGVQVNRFVNSESSNPAHPYLAAVADSSAQGLHGVESGISKNVQFLELPEAEILINDSWEHFQSVSPTRLTEGLVIVCFVSKRLELAEEVLRDLKLKFTPARLTEHEVYLNSQVIKHTSLCLPSCGRLS